MTDPSPIVQTLAVSIADKYELVTGRRMLVTTAACLAGAALEALRAFPLADVVEAMEDE